MFDMKVETPQKDLELFNRLGLKPFSIPQRQKHYLSRLYYEGGFVEIGVKGLPALFWEITVVRKNDDGHTVTYVLETGSGALSDFWPTVDMLMDGMLKVSVRQWEQEN